MNVFALQSLEYIIIKVTSGQSQIEFSFNTSFYFTALWTGNGTGNRNMDRNWTGTGNRTRTGNRNRPGNRNRNRNRPGTGNRNRTGTGNENGTENKNGNGTRTGTVGTWYADGCFGRGKSFGAHVGVILD